MNFQKLAKTLTKELTRNPKKTAALAIGLGVAGAMLEDAIARLRRAGVRRVELTVEADNPRAIAFYQRLGFMHEGTQRAAYKRAADDGYVDELMYGLLLDD